jgi:hypothetical protein
MAQVSSADSRHRSTLSLDTNASGIAGSTMSMGGESLRLSQFPHPPTEIPTTPLQSDFESSTPTRTVFSAQTTPRSRHHPKPPHNTPTRKPAPPAEKNDLASMRPPIDTSYPPPAAPTSLRSPNRGLVDSTVIPSHVFSPHDWHEGASSIDVDPTEDQLLPTSFITALLSSTPFNRDGQRSRNTRRNGGKPHNFPYSDVFESSYGAVDRSANPRMRGNPHLAATSHLAAPPVAFQTRSYFPRGLPSDDPPESLLSDHMSSDSITLNSMTDNNSAFAVYGFSPEKKFGYPGGSIISDAPTSLRDPRSRSPESSTRGLLPNQNASGHAFNSAQDVDVDERFLKGGSAMIFSPAFPSTAGSQTHFREEGLVRRETRQSAHSAKTTKSFFSVVSSVAAKPAALVKGVLGWRAVKPLPPIPRVPNISLAAEMEHRRQEENMPTSQLANRANTLAHLLEKDNFSYHTLDSSIGDRRDPQPRQAGQSHTGPDQGQGVQLFFPRDLIPQRGKAAEPLPSRNIARLGRRKTKRKAFAIALVAIVAIGIGVGVGVTRRRRSAQPSCPGNTAGALCNLS